MTAHEELLEVARAALDHYDLPSRREIEPIRLTNNAVFEVRAGGEQHALRVHRPEYRSPAQVRSELAFLRTLGPQLAGTKVDAPQPLETRDGELVVRAGTNDGLLCVLFTWIDGSELKPTRGLGPRSAFLLGEALARLHVAAERFEPPPGFDVPAWDAETMFTSESPFQPGPMESFLPAEAWPLFRDVARLTRSVFEQLDELPGARGLIHADFILSNCRFARRDRGWRLGVLDFDDLGCGYYLYDLAPLLGNLADFPDSYPRLRRAVLDGYRSVRPLPAPLDVHLPALMAARHAVALTWLAAKQRRGETDLSISIERLVTYRLEAMRACLTEESLG